MVSTIVDVPGSEARGREFAARLERLLLRRALQRDSFIERAKVWESGRPPSAGDVVFPRDTAAVVALGVPCVDCLVLVHFEGQPGGTWPAEVAAELDAVAQMRGDGPDDGAGVGHRVVFGVLPGRHWAEFVVARCSR